MGFENLKFIITILSSLSLSLSCPFFSRRGGGPGLWVNSTIVVFLITFRLRGRPRRWYTTRRPNQNERNNQTRTVLYRVWQSAGKRRAKSSLRETGALPPQAGAPRSEATPVPPPPRWRTANRACHCRKRRPKLSRHLMP